MEMGMAECTGGGWELDDGPSVRTQVASIPNMMSNPTRPLWEAQVFITRMEIMGWSPADEEKINLHCHTGI